MTAMHVTTLARACSHALSEGTLLPSRAQHDAFALPNLLLCRPICPRGMVVWQMAQQTSKHTLGSGVLTGPRLPGERMRPPSGALLSSLSMSSMAHPRA